MEKYMVSEEEFFGCEAAGGMSIAIITTLDIV